MHKRPLQQLDVTIQTTHESLPNETMKTMASKQGSCSPPLVTSSENSDTEVDTSKEIFFREMRLRYRKNTNSEEELNMKIDQMWESLSHEHRQAVLKSIQNKSPSQNKFATPVGTNIERKKRQALSSKKTGKVFRSLKAEIQNEISKTKSVPDSDDQCTPKITTELTGATHSDSMKKRMFYCKSECPTLKQAALYITNPPPNDSLVTNPPIEVQEEDLQVCSIPLLTKKAKSPPAPVLLKVEKKIEAPTTIGGKEKIVIILPATFERKRPAPKWAPPPASSLPLNVANPPPVARTKIVRLQPPASKPSVAGQNGSMEKSATAKPRSLRKVALKRPIDKVAEAAKNDEMELVKMPFDKVCEQYYLGLCQPLIRAHNEKPLTKYNQQSLANIVEGWKVVREYRGLL